MPFKLQRKGRKESQQQLETLFDSSNIFCLKKHSRERLNFANVIGITVECISIRREQKPANKEEERKYRKLKGLIKMTSRTESF